MNRIRPVGQENEWEWIDRYWAGQLPPDEQAFFKQVMNDDPRFADEAESLRYGLQMLETTRMERHIRQTLEHLNTAARQQRLGRIRWIGWGSGLAAACVGVLLLLFWPVHLPGHDSDLETIRALQETENTKPNPLVAQRRQTFELFFDAQALLSEGQPGLAAQRFEQLLTYPNLRPYFEEAVAWHLVICYLKTDQPAKARQRYNQVNGKEAYDIGLIDRWRIDWQIRVAELTTGKSGEK